MCVGVYSVSDLPPYLGVGRASPRSPGEFTQSDSSGTLFGRAKPFLMKFDLFALEMSSEQK